MRMTRANVPGFSYICIGRIIFIVVGLGPAPLRNVAGLFFVRAISGRFGGHKRKNGITDHPGVSRPLQGVFGKNNSREPGR